MAAAAATAVLVAAAATALSTAVDPPPGVSTHQMQQVLQLYNAAVHAANAGDDDVAIDLYKRSMDIFPFGHALLNLGQLYSRRGQMQVLFAGVETKQLTGV